jgi:hypothetical protein
MSDYQDSSSGVGPPSEQTQLVFESLLIISRVAKLEDTATETHLGATVIEAHQGVTT